MALHDFVDGDILTEGQLDTVATQAIIRCTSGGRPGSPVVGMTIYETDTDYMRSWDGGAWISWPKGNLDTSPGIGTGSGFFINSNVDVNGSLCAATLYVGERYRYTYSFPFAGSVAGAAFSSRPYKDDSGSYAVFGTQYDCPIAVATANFAISGHADFTVSSDGACNVKMMVDGPGIGSGFGAIVSGGRFSLDHISGSQT